MIERLQIDGPSHAHWALILAHGAGAPMDHPFMETVSQRIAGSGVRVIRFDFPYMQRRRVEGGRRPPDRLPVLRDTFRSVIEAVSAPRLAIGGKSMGGRIATLLAADDPDLCDAVVCLGYPFHPPGKPDRLRTDHLAELSVPTLIVQGTRDALGSRDEVADYALSESIRIHWLEDGDHSFKPRKRSGYEESEHLATAGDAVRSFLRGLSAVED